MPDLKLSVFCGFPSYGGNGGISSEVPNIREWWGETILKMRADSRISHLDHKTLNDTPITMVRNQFVKRAKQCKADLLLMIDSDQDPNRHKHEDWYKPFWDEAFNFIYEHYWDGPRMVFAPYCGPPGVTENVYVFQWRNYGNRGPETEYTLEAYTREQACLMTGIQEAAAGPTGMILIDMRLFDLVEPSWRTKREVFEQVKCGSMSVEDALAASKEGYFYYEWRDQHADEKASTEDVTFTRDVAIAGQLKYGYNPVFCAWDSWIGHHKPWNVGKPQRFSTAQVGASLRKAVLEDHQPSEAILDMTRFTRWKDDPDLADLNRRADEAVKAAEAAGLVTFTQAQRRNPDGIAVVDFPQGVGSVRDATTGNWRDHGHAAPFHQMTLASMVRDIAFRKQRLIRVLEVGSWIGRTAIMIADAVKECHVHCVDTWEGTPSDMTGAMAKEAEEEVGPDGVYKEFLKNVGERLNKTIFPWRGPSAHYSAMEWQKFDLIFIDADHTYEGCREDIIGWWKHLAEDGVMVGHDYMTHDCCGVTKAADEIFGDGLRTAGWHPQGAMWVAYKKDNPNPNFGDAKCPTAA